MNQIKRPHKNYMGYPVGENLKESIFEIKTMINDFIYSASDDINNSSRINIIGRGSSGTIIGTFFVNDLLLLYPDKDIRFIYIKKENENSHHSDLISSDFRGLNIFVDDFISSGETLKAAINKIRYDLSDGDFSFDWVVEGNGVIYDSIGKNVTKNLVSYWY